MMKTKYTTWIITCLLGLLVVNFKQVQSDTIGFSEDIVLHLENEHDQKKLLMYKLLVDSLYKQARADQPKLKAILIALSQCKLLNSVQVSTEGDKIHVWASINPKIHKVYVHTSNIFTDVILKKVLYAYNIRPGALWDKGQIEYLEVMFEKFLATSKDFSPNDKFYLRALFDENNKFNVYAFVKKGRPSYLSDRSHLTLVGVKSFDPQKVKANIIPTYLLGDLYRHDVKKVLASQYIVNAITRFYVDRGFLDCKVIAQKLVVSEYSEPNYIIEINEGPRYTLGSVQLLDMGAYVDNKHQSLNQSEKLKLSRVIKRRIIRSNNKVIESRFYVECQKQLQELLLAADRVGSEVQYIQVLDRDNHKVDFIFNIFGGFKEPKIGNIKLVGNNTTIERFCSLISLRTDEKFSWHKINNAKKRLQELSYIKNCDCQVDVSDDNRVNLTFYLSSIGVTERFNSTLNCQIPIGSNAPAEISASLSDRNFASLGIPGSAEVVFLKVPSDMGDFISQLETSGVKSLIDLSFRFNIEVPNSISRYPLSLSVNVVPDLLINNINKNIEQATQFSAEQKIALGADTKLTVGISKIVQDPSLLLKVQTSLINKVDTELTEDAYPSLFSSVSLDRTLSIGNINYPIYLTGKGGIKFYGTSHAKATLGGIMDYSKHNFNLIIEAEASDSFALTNTDSVSAMMLADHIHTPFRNKVYASGARLDLMDFTNIQDKYDLSDRQREQLNPTMSIGGDRSCLLRSSILFSIANGLKLCFTGSACHTLITQRIASLLNKYIPGHITYVIGTYLVIALPLMGNLLIGVSKEIKPLLSNADLFKDFKLIVKLAMPNDFIL